MKKLLAVLLSLVFVFSFAIFAYAAPGDEEVAAEATTAASEDATEETTENAESAEEEATTEDTEEKDVDIDTNTTGDISSDEEGLIDDEWLEKDGNILEENHITVKGLDKYDNPSGVTLKFKRIKDDKSSKAASYTYTFKSTNDFSVNIPENIIEGTYKVVIMSTGDLDTVKLKTKKIKLSKDAGEVVIETGKVIAKKNLFQKFVLEEKGLLIVLVGASIGYYTLKRKRLAIESER